MDFNDILTRLNMIYDSLNTKIDANVFDHMNQTNDYVGKCINISFGLSDVAAASKIFQIINDLWALKDILINKYKTKGGYPKLIEEEINSSNHLSIIWDLSNAYKHTHPVSRNKRSKKDPKIINIKSWLGIDPLNRGRVSIDLDSGAKTKNMVVTIHADIVDANNVFLYELNDLIKNAMMDWNMIINKYDLTSS